MLPENQFLFSVDGAARALDLSRSKLYDMMRRGQLRFVMIGADRRIPVEELRRLAAEGTGQDQRRSFV